MQNRISFKTLALVALFLFCAVGCKGEDNAKDQIEQFSQAWMSQCKDWDDWDNPGPAFRVFGNTYYVGTCGISAILITSKDGHVLLDGGTEQGAKVVIENIESLGFSISDVKILSHSHEHFDHVAGLAEIQRQSGAQLFASEQAAPVLTSGVVAKNDPQSGMHEPFPAARVDKVLTDGEKITLGKIELNSMSTPGHSPGALSWQWRSCDEGECFSIVYADSLSPISRDDFRFSDQPDYVDAYKAGLEKVAKVECDILLAPHPSASMMPQRLAQDNGLFDSGACSGYSSRVLVRLDKRLRSESE